MTSHSIGPQPRSLAGTASAMSALFNPGTR